MRGPSTSSGHDRSGGRHRTDNALNFHTIEQPRIAPRRSSAFGIRSNNCSSRSPGFPHFTVPLVPSRCKLVFSQADGMILTVGWRLRVGADECWHSPITETPAYESLIVPSSCSCQFSMPALAPTLGWSGPLKKPRAAKTSGSRNPSQRAGAGTSPCHHPWWLNCASTGPPSRNSALPWASVRPLRTIWCSRTIRAVPGNLTLSVPRGADWCGPASFPRSAYTHGDTHTSAS